jgi:PIN domain nuclease of toxin-antitoxin system
MSIHILDASAMVAYLLGEPGEEVVAALLSDPGALCHAHTMNLCEVYYQAIRRTDVHQARQSILSLFADGVIECKRMFRIHGRRRHRETNIADPKTGRRFPRRCAGVSRTRLRA